VERVLTRLQEFEGTKETAERKKENKKKNEKSGNYLKGCCMKQVKEKTTMELKLW
jgi:hypothetical protein